MTQKTKKTLKQFIRNLKYLVPLVLSITLFTILVCTSITINPLLGLLLITCPVLLQLAYFLIKALWYFSEFEVELKEYEKNKGIKQ